MLQIMLFSFCNFQRCELSPHKSLPRILVYILLSRFFLFDSLLLIFVTQTIQNNTFGEARDGGGRAMIEECEFKVLVALDPQKKRGGLLLLPMMESPFFFPASRKIPKLGLLMRVERMVCAYLVLTISEARGYYVQ